MVWSASDSPAVDFKWPRLRVVALWPAVVCHSFCFAYYIEYFLLNIFSCIFSWIFSLKYFLLNIFFWTFKLKLFKRKNSRENNLYPFSCTQLKVPKSKHLLKNNSHISHKTNNKLNCVKWPASISLIPAMAIISTVPSGSRRVRYVASTCDYAWELGTCSKQNRSISTAKYMLCRQCVCVYVCLCAYQ